MRAFAPTRDHRVEHLRQPGAEVAAGWAPIHTPAMQGVLPPRHTGMWFETDDVRVQDLASPFPVVRWTDRWGTRWEHMRGNVREFVEDAAWCP